MEAIVAKVTMFARCPIHGLHGERRDCLICDGPVTQEEFVPISDFRAAEREYILLRETLRELDSAIRRGSNGEVAAQLGHRLEEAESALNDTIVLLERANDAACEMRRAIEEHKVLCSGTAGAGDLPVPSRLERDQRLHSVLESVDPL